MNNSSYLPITRFEPSQKEWLKICKKKKGDKLYASSWSLPLTAKLLAGRKMSQEHSRCSVSHITIWYYPFATRGTFRGHKSNPCEVHNRGNFLLTIALIHSSSFQGFLPCWEEENIWWHPHRCRTASKCLQGCFFFPDFFFKGDSLMRCWGSHFTEICQASINYKVVQRKICFFDNLKIRKS